MDILKSKREGSWGALVGNIAPEGALLCLDGLPVFSHAFRGPIRRFSSIREAASVVSQGGVMHGNILVLPSSSQGWAEGDVSEYAGAVQRSGLDICTVFGGGPCPKGQFGGGSYLWIRQNAALAYLRDGDMLEYDLAAGTIHLDLTPEGFQYRLSGHVDEPFVVSQLDKNTWSILDRYSRMFLVAGQSRALLIDTGFGTADPTSLIRALSGLPLDVVLTHAHWDHAGGIRYFPDIWISKEELPTLRAAAGSDAPCRLRWLTDGQIFDLGGRTLRVIACPGHTPGSVVLLDEGRKMLFSGDSVAEGPIYLFMPECSVHSFAAGLQRLKERAGGIAHIYPSHRSMDLPSSCIAELSDCANGIIAGSIQGEGTCIFKPYTHCKTYHMGRCAIYFH